MGGAGYTADAQGAPTADKTLFDFLRESGSKPAVAVQEYQEYRRTHREPQRGLPLSAVSMGSEEERFGLAEPGKTLADFQRAYSGTKPIVAIQKYHEYLARRKAVK